MKNKMRTLITYSSFSYLFLLGGCLGDPKIGSTYCKIDKKDLSSPSGIKLFDMINARIARESIMVGWSLTVDDVQNDTVIYQKYREYADLRDEDEIKSGREKYSLSPEPKDSVSTSKFKQLLKEQGFTQSNCRALEKIRMDTLLEIKKNYNQEK